MKILVVDDEKPIVKGLKFNLQQDGYEVDTGSDGQEAVEKARAGQYDLIILDLMMPRLDGLEACVQIRSFSDVPIIILTAKAEDTDKLIGFDYGADDYITKPFNILELKARVRAMLRRTTPKPARLGGNGLVLNTERRSVFRDGEEIDLTYREYELAETMMKNPGKVFSRDALLTIIWGDEYQGDTRTVDVHIRRLREKVEPDKDDFKYFLTKWGVGYYFKD